MSAPQAVKFTGESRVADVDGKAVAEFAYRIFEGPVGSERLSDRTYWFRSTALIYGGIFEKIGDDLFPLEVQSEGALR